MTNSTDNEQKKQNKPIGRSKGGSDLYQYPEQEEHAWRPPNAYGSYAEEISAYFKALFPNRKGTVFHELISDLVHIDVNILFPTEQSRYYIMYTTGMSDLPMTMPESLADRQDLQYAELYMFLPESWNPGQNLQLSTDLTEEQYWPIGLIKYLARFPHEYQTWLGWGHTLPNGPDYAPLASGTELGGVVFLQNGGDLAHFVAKDGQKIQLYMVTPVYREEMEYKLNYGMQALDDLFMEKNLPLVIDLHRENFCEEQQ